MFTDLHEEIADTFAGLGGCFDYAGLADNYQVRTGNDVGWQKTLREEERNPQARARRLRRKRESRTQRRLDQEHLSHVRGYHKIWIRQKRQASPAFRADLAAYSRRWYQENPEKAKAAEERRKRKRAARGLPPGYALDDYGCVVKLHRQGAHCAEVVDCAG